MQRQGLEMMEMRKMDARSTPYPGVKKVGPKAYVVRVKVIDPRTGRPRQRERLVEGIDSPREAAAAREELRRELLAEPTETNARARLKDYARSWLAGKRRTLRRTTLERYAAALDLHILPALGDLYVDAITKQDLITWRARQDANPSTVNGWVRILKTMLADATEDLDLPKDPSARLKALHERPTYTDDDPNLLEPEQLRALLEAARSTCPWHYPVFATLAYTGMRTSEALALKWSDIDERAGIIHVRRGQVRGNVGTTKTGKTRTVALDETLAAILREHRQQMVANQIPGLHKGWVFVSETGDLRYGTTLRKPLQQACKAAGIERRFTPHGFRRTFNNLLRQVTTTTVQKALTGHATDRMAEHYSHVAAEEKKVAVGAVVSLVRTARGPRCGRRRRKQKGRLAYRR
jgi:integrase